MATKLRKVLFKKIPFVYLNPKGVEVKAEDFDYREAFLSALNNPPIDERTGQSRGFGPREIRKRNKIIDFIEEAKGKDFVLLEKADYDELKEAVDNQKWLVTSKAIEQYLDDIEKAEEVEVEEKVEEKKKK